MNQKYALLAVIALLAIALNFARGGQGGVGKYEYVTIRWDGRDNTHIIRPGGNVEFIGAELKRLKKPNAADERSFFMNAALNGLAAHGYEVAAMTPDEIVMRHSK